MNLNFLKVFLRSLRKHKVVSLINVSGLVIGLLSSLLIFEYVFFERSYDKYHTNASQIYRVVYNRYQEGKLQWETANSFYPTGQWMKGHFSEVEDYATISRKYNITVSYEDAVDDKVFYNEPKTYYAGSSLFRLFTIPLLQGSRDCLDKPNTVAVSEKVAEKYFGKENPLGKQITVNGREKYMVTAVFRNIPENSHLKSGFFFSLPTVISQRPALANNWGNDYFHTYLMLKPGTDFREFSKKAFPEMIARNYKSSLDAGNMHDDFYLQPLPDIHLYSNIEYETELPGNAKTTGILFGFSIFLLAVAWINYINLVTARAIDRAREIGVRKITGAKRLPLVFQFIAEAFIFNVGCLIITLLLFFVFNPYFKNVAGISDFSLFRNPGFMANALAVFLAGVIFSGIYPALVLSSFKPVAVLKGKLKNSVQGMLFRRGLVTVQFVISVVLLIGTLVTFRQASLLMKKDMGVDYNSCLVIRAPHTSDVLDVQMNKLMLYRDEVLRLPEVKEFTFASDIPGQEIDHWFWGYRKGFSNDDGKAYFQIGVDDRFLDFYKVKLLAGRKFMKDEKASQCTVILNVQAMKRLGYSNPGEVIGNYIVSGNKKEWLVVGVVDDFYYKSVKTAPVPTILTLDDRGKSFLIARVNGISQGNYASLATKLKNLYDGIFPGQPFEYFSLDEKMRMDLKPDKMFASVFGLFSALAIFIAVIGIVGLILITINQNLKELGIRKALGAESGDVSVLLAKQLLPQFFIALVSAIPLSYFGYKNWFLNSYIHRIELNAWFFIIPSFLLAAVVSLVIVLISANVFRMKAAEVLQYE